MSGPDLRLSVPLDGGTLPKKVEGALRPAVRLAIGRTVNGDRRPGLDGAAVAATDLPLPALLVSYIYLEPFQRHRVRYAFRDWVMDSGAFSAFNAGATVNLDAYIRTAQELLATDAQLTEVYSLDVIGDWQASLRNAEIMWQAGVPAIPTYHYGEPLAVLRGLAADYPKVAVGGVAGRMRSVNEQRAWLHKVFDAIYPHKIHAFGINRRELLLPHRNPAKTGFPFHSCDATNWEVGPVKFGTWKMGDKAVRLSIHGSSQNLRTQVEHYLRLERLMQHAWAKEMARLDALPTNPALRLACNGKGQGEMNGALRAPTVRLAGMGGSGNTGAENLAKALGPRD